jgi:hypothetical protein
MDPTTTNIDPEVYRILFFIASAIISLLLGVLIWSAQRLVDTVRKLGFAVQTLLTQMEERKTSCAEKHKVIDQRLAAHSRKLSEHDMEITKLQTIVQ